MRTTLTIDDELAGALRKRAYESGRPFKEVVNEALRAGLEQGRTTPAARPYRLEPVSLGGPRPGVNLDKAVRLAGELEDAELAGKLEMRK